MKETDKLRVLLPHWIEHNEDHANEFRDWALQAGTATDDIQAAAAALLHANEFLESALKKLGGALPPPNLQEE
ncbi:MAG: hypothetical protein ACK2UM_02455 [Anaerolineales bacterium]|jgi:hypothetical protein